MADAASQTPVAVITGASSPSGAAICRRLSIEGVAIVGTYLRHRERAAELVADLAATSIIEMLQVDVTSAQHVDRLFSHVSETHGRLDYLVTVASFSHPSLWNISLLDLALETWEEALATDLTGTLRCLRTAIPLMLATTRRGSIVTFSSAGALQGDPDTLAYNAAKAGIVSISRSVARLYGPTIRCNVIAPGSIDTGWISEWHLDSSEVASLTAMTRGMRRIGSPAEVADVTEFLLSPRSSYVNGQIIRVDGGATL